MQNYTKLLFYKKLKIQIITIFIKKPSKTQSIENLASQNLLLKHKNK